MRLFFRLLLIFLFLVNANAVYGNEYSAVYKVASKGIKIGELRWSVKKDGKDYEISIGLKSKGVLSGVLRFEGNYLSVGKININELIPKNYSQSWSTSKKHRVVKISFDKKKVVELSQRPLEKERARLDYFSLTDYSDPLTSFFKILEGADDVKTIDGRRIYNITLVEEGPKKNKKTYSIKNYVNIWADHKKNDLEKISIIKKEDYLPEVVNIYFKGQKFKISKN